MTAVADAIGIRRQNVSAIHNRPPPEPRGRPPLPDADDARTVIEQLTAWLTHCNEVHPYKALGYCSPSEFLSGI